MVAIYTAIFGKYERGKEVMVSIVVPAESLDELVTNFWEEKGEDWDLKHFSKLSLDTIVNLLPRAEEPPILEQEVIKIPRSKSKNKLMQEIIQTGNWELLKENKKRFTAHELKYINSKIKKPPQ